MGCLIGIENKGGEKLDHLQQVVHRQICDHCESAEGTVNGDRDLLSFTV